MEEADRSNKPITRVSFRIISSDLDPYLVTQALNLTPDHAHRNGDYISNTNRSTYKQGLWSINSKLSKEGSFSGHLEGLLSILEPVQEPILKLGEDHTLEFYCGLFSYTGFDLSPDILKQIANLGATLGVAIYCS